MKIKNVVYLFKLLKQISLNLKKKKFFLIFSYVENRKTKTYARVFYLTFNKFLESYIHTYIPYVNIFVM